MSKIRFFTNPMSRAQIVRWALHEVGADYEQVLLEYGGSMKGEEFLAINPMGKVPAITHRGQVVTEAAAICAYLAESFPQAGLLPRPAERAPYYRWMFFAAGPVDSAVMLHNLEWHPSEEQQRMVGFGTYERTIEVLSAWFAEHTYVCGERFTMADVYVGSQVDWGVGFGTMPKRDELVAYAERLQQRDAYKAAKAIDNQLIAKMQPPS